MFKKLRKLNIEQRTRRDERKRTMEDVEKLIAMINTQLINYRLLQFQGVKSSRQLLYIQ